jgi:hypothetical protein
MPAVASTTGGLGALLAASARLRRGLEALQWTLVAGWALALLVRRLQAGRRVLTVPRRGVPIASALCFAVAAWLLAGALGARLPSWLDWPRALAWPILGDGVAPGLLVALWGAQLLGGLHVHEGGLHARGALLAWSDLLAYGFVGARLVCVEARRSRRTRAFDVPTDRQPAVASLLARWAPTAGGSVGPARRRLTTPMLRALAAVGSFALLRAAWVALALGLAARDLLH